MNILAAFFLVGLFIAGLRFLVRHLWLSLQPFNNNEAFLIQSIEAENVNQLSVASNEGARRDSDFIRITSTQGLNDRIKRLPAHHEHERPDLEIRLSATC